MNKKTNINKKYVTEVGEALATFYDKALMERMIAPSPFLTDVEVTEMVPRYTIRIPYLYFRREDEGEIIVGFYLKKLFTLGKKKQKRFLYTWELPKKKRKQNVIKFKRYGSINDTGPKYE